MQEESNDQFVHLAVLGKRQGFADQPPEALAQGVVEALDVICRAPFGVAGLMLAGRQDIVIALQMIRIQ